ncbi:MAG: carbohydrate ABC transporter permease [Thermanaerothrix sp.]|jgi:alpha-glucoside transport system permease protein|uniref:Sugar ABC transporter permease n=1 Tax=Thermanaerothrix solaris TaxID=3058434 RepID=A0ABU3NQ34_9CHLR|nr:sugar ABC transporter permease [Thermanaerothrix sp. 4228-RoL]MDT8898946.1 sugar ABC transporter permease [Thermanaerothrix sp. 4228-RoL]
MAKEAAYVPNILRQGRWVPWLYLGPALVLMSIFILYPGLNTLYLSFRNQNGSDWAYTTCLAGQPCWGIFENYRYALTSSIMRTAFGNNLKWIVFMVSGTVLLGLLIATLADRVRYEALAKAIIFMPMAISFVGAGVIWKFVYDYGSSQVQIGLLNALITALGGRPVSWLTEPQINTLALIVVGIWMWTGFCMTVLSAAIKGVPAELLEAARVDGANEWTVFWKIRVPLILPTIAVVITTMIINVLKIFDIVYVMTGGNYGTEVIANRLYIEMYTSYNTGRAAAIAMVLTVIIIPAIVFNIRRFRAQEAMR